LEDTFRGSIDRFCDIAVAFHQCRKVLDVGSGDGAVARIVEDARTSSVCGGFSSITKAVLSTKGTAFPFSVCDIEADALPFQTDSLDAVSYCQALENFTHSHLPPVMEMRRVLKPSRHSRDRRAQNRSRMLRGKHTTYDYEEHYLNASLSSTRAGILP
jgi:SAM-dependent methyltransferase